MSYVILPVKQIGTLQSRLPSVGVGALRAVRAREHLRERVRHRLVVRRIAPWGRVRRARDLRLVLGAPQGGIDGGGPRARRARRGSRIRRSCRRGGSRTGEWGQRAV